MSGRVVEVVEPTFTAQVDVTPESVLVRLTGNGDVIAYPHMERVFRAAHGGAQGTPPKAVRLDIRELSFMSSSCFKHLVLWMQQILALAPESRYQVGVDSARKHAWQARSLRTLTNFAGQVVQVHQS